MNPARRYRIVLSRRAERQFGKLPPQVRVRVAERIDGLADDPRGPGVKSLHGSDAGFRVRIGDYRALFDVDEEAQELVISVIGHRREVYKR